MHEALRDQSLSSSQQQQQLYYQSLMKRDYQGGSTLENSFGISNKSYERILAETIEAQNSNAGNCGPQHHFKLSSTGAYQNPQNMTLQLSSKRGGQGSANASQSRFNA